MGKVLEGYKAKSSMVLGDEATGQMRCRKCGHEHTATPQARARNFAPWTCAALPREAIQESARIGLDRGIGAVKAAWRRLAADPRLRDVKLKRPGTNPLVKFYRD